MQQSDHFEYEYHAMLLRNLPPLVPQQPSTISRVGVIPSSIKRTPLIPATHETTTLTHRLEPVTNTTAADISVFSGPRYLPEKYSIKAVTTFRQTYFTPNYKNEPPSRYYVSPHVNQYFQAALQDGSYFESYSEYKPQDPVNFRHAYNLQQPQNSRKFPHISIVIICTDYILVDTTHVERDTRPLYPSNNNKKSVPTSTPRRIPTVRKWHRPIIANSPSTSEDDSEPSVIFTGNSSRKGKEKEIIDQKEIQIQRKPSVQRELSITSDDTSIESDSSTETDDMAQLKNPKPPIPQKRKQPSSPTPHANKKKRFNAFVPTKKEAVEELRQLGKFIKGWTHKDAEVCCVCFEDVTTSNNPLVYCDNALCEVIVHKNCYRIRNNIANADHWYCDRCRPVNGVSVYQNVVCFI